MQEPARWSEARCAQYEFTIEIAASREALWRGITDQLGSWWLPDFHMLGTDSVVILEPHAGGRLYEQNGDQHLLWYTVLAIQPSESLDLIGHISAKYGGPATTMLNITLTAESTTRTTLRFSDSIYGRISDGLVNSLSSGWKSLFSDGLKKHLET